MSPKQLSPSRRSRGHKRKILFLAYVAFLGLLATNLSLHEMWRDELQAYGLAVEAESPWQLPEVMRTEPHPGLWHLVIHLADRLWSDPAVMKIANFLFTAALGAVLLRFAPFSWWVKILLLLGYFPVYEYGTISRCYALALLLMVSWAALFPWNRGRGLAGGLILALLCQTSAFAVFPAVSFLVAMILQRQRVRHSLRAGLADPVNWTIVLLFAGGLVLAALQAIPPDDAAMFQGLRPLTFERVFEPFWMLGRALVPVGVLHESFWRYHLVSHFAVPWSFALPAVIALATLVLFLFALRRSREALVMILLTGSVHIIFKIVKFQGDLRHDGHLVWTLVLAWWIATRQGLAPPADPRGAGSTTPARIERWSKVSAIVLLAANLLGALRASIGEWMYPFSLAREAAEMVEQSVAQDQTILAWNDAVVSPVMLLADRSAVSLNSGRRFSYIRWLRDRQERTPEQVVALSRAYADRHGPTWLLVNQPLPQALAGGEIRFVDRVDRPRIVSEERYYLYRVSGTVGDRESTSR